MALSLYCIFGKKGFCGFKKENSSNTNFANAYGGNPISSLSGSHTEALDDHLGLTFQAKHISLHK